MEPHTGASLFRSAELTAPMLYYNRLLLVGAALLGHLLLTQTQELLEKELVDAKAHKDRVSARCIVGWGYCDHHLQQCVLLRRGGLSSSSQRRRHTTASRSRISPSRRRRRTRSSSRCAAAGSHGDVGRPIMLGKSPFICNTAFSSSDRRSRERRRKCRFGVRCPSFHCCFYVAAVSLFIQSYVIIFFLQISVLAQGSRDVARRDGGTVVSPPNLYYDLTTP